MDSSHLTAFLIEVCVDNTPTAFKPVTARHVPYIKQIPQRPYQEPSDFWLLLSHLTADRTEGSCFGIFVNVPRYSSVRPVKSADDGSVKIKSAFSIGRMLKSLLFVFFSNAGHPPSSFCIVKTQCNPLFQACR